MTRKFVYFVTTFSKNHRGIETTHPDFGGRARHGADFIKSPPPSDVDPNGHGTVCAGIAMANTYGLAKKATAIAVRVLSKSGEGSIRYYNAY